MGWKVELYSVGVGGNNSAEGPDHAVWLTSLAFFLLFHPFECSLFLWAKIGCMVRIAAVEVAEKLFWSIRRSTAFSATTTAASALVP